MKCIIYLYIYLYLREILYESPLNLNLRWPIKSLVFKSKSVKLVVENDEIRDYYIKC